MALSIKSSGDLIAVSRLKQSDATTAGSFADVAGNGLEDGGLILFDENSGISVPDNRESDAQEKTGHVEATNVDVLDRSAEGTLTAAKATPDAIAWMAAFFMGHSAKATIEAGPGIFEHTSQLTTYPTEPNYFTSVHRKGGAGGGGSAEVRRHIGLGANTWRLLAAKEEFLTSELGILGLGKFDDGTHTEDFSHDFSGADTEVITYDPIGDDPGVITAVVDSDGDGIYDTVLDVDSYVQGTKTVGWTAASASDLSTTLPLKIIYAVKASEAHFVGDWLTDVEALTTPEEFKLKAANIQLILGGNYDGTTVPTNVGGQVAGCEVEQLEYTGDWQGNPGRCWRTGAEASATAQSVDLNDVVQSINVDRRVQDYLFKYAFDENLPIGMYFDAIGPEIPGTASANKFHVKVYWPRLKFLTKPLEVRDGRWVEAGSLVVLKDTVNDWPTMTVEVQNKVEEYLTV